MRGLDKSQFKQLRELTHHAKNLYNQTLWTLRQAYETTGRNDPYPKMDKAMKQVHNLEGFRVWSHIVYDVDASVNLSGTPDFLIARPKKVGIGNLIDVPPLCVIEAKKRDWDNAWGQALAESYAASTQGPLFVMLLLLMVNNGNLVNILKNLHYF
ncbi:conserved hypothetical protein [Beggiatoa sp. PS]|nr:conserved hypothetical protein [Beggiatoa sp. PS]